MADFVVGGKVQFDPGNSPQTLSDLKKSIRSAKDELIAMQAKFGETSKEASIAAQNVANLEDKLGDAKKLVDAFNPDQKFRAFSQSLSGVLGGFTALTGAMGLLGVESENVQKQLLKVQSALALSQGLNQVGEAVNSFRNLGRVLLNTFGKGGVIGIAIAGVVALGAAIVSAFNRMSESEKAAKKALEEYTKAATEARKNIIEVTTAFELARNGVISKEQALKTYNETLGETFGKTNDLSDAERIVVENADAYIKVTGLKAQATSLFAAQAELANKALVAEQMALKVNVGIVKNFFSDMASDSKKSADEINNLIKDIFKQINDVQSGMTKVGGLFGVGTGFKKTTGLKTAKEKEKEDPFKDLTKRQEKVEIEEDPEVKAQRERNEKLGALYDDLLSKNSSYYANKKRLEQESIESARQEAEARIRYAYDIGNALGALSELIGKQTAAGKALGIAQAGINMWIGVSEVLRAKSVLPEPAATIAKVVNIATIIATGLNAIKNIVKVQVPGGGGGGGVSAPSVATTAPLLPQVPQSTRTRLDQDQLNQIGNAAVRAFVVESDIASNRDRIVRLNRAARLG